MFTVAVLVLCLSHGALGKLVIGEQGNGEKIPIDVTVKDHTILTVSGQPKNPEWFLKSSMNLYDFHQHLEARLVIDEDACYIRNFTGTWEDAKKIVNGGKGAKASVKEEWNIPGEEIPADKLEETVGGKIAEFCADYKVFWSSEEKLAKRGGPWSLGGNYKNGALHGGLSYQRRRFQAHVGGSWRPGGGYSASAGFSWSFGK